MSSQGVNPDINAIEVNGLTYKHNNYSERAPPALVDLSLNLPKGSRTLLIGANGAGKSTLLQILAGKRLIKSSDVRVFSKDVFRDSPPGITFLGTEWAMNPVVRSDIVVSNFLDSVGGYRHKARRDRLLDILDVDLDWHMHTISDGERRRVQLVMGLMAEWDLLLLDEAIRDDLLTFLKEESETRGATILYATHIFDGLNTFPTHVAHMRFGQFVSQPTPWLQDKTQSNLPPPASGSTLHALALQWLKEDRAFRQQEETSGRLSKTRGAKPDTGVPTNSETFYKK
ncbi:P-loop nucleoside triphosphate hydrolase [Ceratobasidium theobromae]|uniref:P-loop nucleoside triphosphate hydrolase n=1 Tax=Ceratobasidium theobromae TaxID=1582974 RepID=A0A5N5QM88_9AGAM|nr:P-loop nucleoside triphosphate hydrolase [Ceratobasidium theobromae]